MMTNSVCPSFQVRPVVFGRDGVLPAQRVPPVRRRPLRGPRLRLGHRRRGVCKVRFLVPNLSAIELIPKILINMNYRVTYLVSKNLPLT